MMRSPPVRSGFLFLLLLPPAAAGADDAKKTDKKADPKAGQAMTVPARELGIKKKDDKPNPKAVKDKVIAAGEFFGRVVAVGEEQDTLTVQVTVRIAWPNSDAVASLADLQQQLAEALRNPDPAERVAEVQRIRGEVVEAQANLYTLEEYQQDLELQLAKDLKVRVLRPPQAFDGKGNYRKYTAKELAELKGPEKLPGYRSEFAMLKAEQVVKVSLGRKKGDATPLVTMVLIVGEPAE